MKVIRAAVSDADPGARRAARLLYWVMHNIPSLQSTMKGVFNDMDAATQRHIRTEATSENAELADLFFIQENPHIMQEMKQTSIAPSAARTAAPTAAQSIAAAAAEEERKGEKSQAVAAAVVYEETSISEFDGMLEEDDDVLAESTLRRSGFNRCATSSITNSTSTTMLKPSRRLSLSSGPVRVQR